MYGTQVGPQAAADDGYINGYNRYNGYTRRYIISPIQRHRTLQKRQYGAKERQNNALHRPFQTLHVAVTNVTSTVTMVTIAASVVTNSCFNVVGCCSITHMCATEFTTLSARRFGGLSLAFASVQILLHSNEHSSLQRSNFYNRFSQCTAQSHWLHCHTCRHVFNEPQQPAGDPDKKVHYS